MKQVCMQFTVSGRVQGVWYRASTVDKAKELGLTGWVRNVSNGDVELIACGPEQIVAQLEEWLWQGPDSAKVTNVTNKEIPWQSFNEFKQIY